MQTGQALMKDLGEYEPAPGTLAFWWLGQLSYLVKVGKTVLCFDPYLAPSPHRTVPPLLSPGDLSDVDWVFGSHDHGDHIDPYAITGIAAAAPQARFVCSRVAAGHLRELGVAEERIVSLDDRQVHQEAGVRIEAVASQHEFFDRDPDLGYPYLGFLVEVEGLTIYHSGDTLRYDGLGKRLAQHDVDLAFLPINGRDAERYKRNCEGNMTYQEAVDLAGQVQPRLTVPGHYEMFANNSEDPQLFASYMRAKFPDLSFWIGEHGDRIVLPPA